MSEFETLAKDGVLLHGTLQQYSAAFEAVDADHDGAHPVRQLVRIADDELGLCDESKYQQIHQAQQIDTQDWVEVT